MLWLYVLTSILRPPTNWTQNCWKEWWCQYVFQSFISDVFKTNFEGTIPFTYATYFWRRHTKLRPVMMSQGLYFGKKDAKSSVFQRLLSLSWCDLWRSQIWIGWKTYFDLPCCPMIHTVRLGRIISSWPSDHCAKRDERDKKETSPKSQKGGFFSLSLQILSNCTKNSVKSKHLNFRNFKMVPRRFSVKSQHHLSSTRNPKFAIATI